MQLAHSSRSWVGLPFGNVVVVVAEPCDAPLRLATPDGLEPPPHAANPIDATAATAAVRRQMFIDWRMPVFYDAADKAGIKAPDF
jgi:hypothetical protein